MVEDVRLPADRAAPLRFLSRQPRIEGLLLDLPEVLVDLVVVPESLVARI